MKKKRKEHPKGYCKEQGYHDWEVVGVSGKLPTQEVDLQCRICQRNWIAYMEMFEDENDDATQSGE
jgi:hypothetical protein